MAQTLWLVSLALCMIGIDTWQERADRPQLRMQELLSNSESGPACNEGQDFTNPPLHMVVDRVHGGITPGQGGLPADN